MSVPRLRLPLQARRMGASRGGPPRAARAERGTNVGQPRSFCAHIYSSPSGLDLELCRDRAPGCVSFHRRPSALLPTPIRGRIGNRAEYWAKQSDRLVAPRLAYTIEAPTGPAARVQADDRHSEPRHIRITMIDATTGAPVTDSGASSPIAPGESRSVGVFSSAFTGSAFCRFEVLDGTGADVRGDLVIGASGANDTTLVSVPGT